MYLGGPMLTAIFLRPALAVIWGDERCVKYCGEAQLLDDYVLQYFYSLVLPT